MKEDTKLVFEKLKYEIIRCHYYWILYRQLAGTNEGRIDIINKTTPSFFLMYQDLFFDYITLELSKLTDPAELRNFKNLSLFYLLELLKVEVDEKFFEKIEKILSKLIFETEFFRNRRNKKVAHRDLISADQTENFGISRQRVEDALSIVREFMNTIEIYFFNNETMYREFITDLKEDGVALLINLSKALAYDDLVKQQKIPIRLWEKYGNVF